MLLIILLYNQAKDGNHLFLDLLHQKNKKSLFVKSLLDIFDKLQPKMVSLNFIFIFLTVLDLCCCPQAFSGCDEQGLLLVAVSGFFVAVASPVAEHGL